MLSLLALASVIGVLAGVAGRVPMWVAGLPLFLLVTYVAELRAELRRQRAVSRRQRRSEAVAKVRRRRVDLATRLENRRRAPSGQPAYGRAASGRAASGPAAPGLRAYPRQGPDQPSNDPLVEVPDTWQPVAVPLPTYVTALRAPSRTIDVSAEGSWTAARDTASDDTTEIPVVTAYAEAASPADASEEGPAQRRAVND